MAILKRNKSLDDVTAEEAYTWLQENQREYANAIKAELESGQTPDDIFYRLLGRIGTDRRALAMRCKLAAEHLAGGNE